MIYAFDLDGTIADYGKSVPPDIANAINSIGHVHIISGGKSEHIEKCTALIKSKTIHGLADTPGNFRIDLCKIIIHERYPRWFRKWLFNKMRGYQEVRRNLILHMREEFSPYVYAGGRATVDVMVARNKGDVMRELMADDDVTYFYDCEWEMNHPICNDRPAADLATRAIRTSYANFLDDFGKL